MVSGNVAHNKNVIKKISNSLAKRNEENLARTDAPLPVYQDGQSTTQIMTVPSLGIDPATGKEIYRKRNGHKTFIWNANDKVPMGDTTPAYTGTRRAMLSGRTSVSILHVCSIWTMINTTQRW